MGGAGGMALWLHGHCSGSCTVEDHLRGGKRGEEGEEIGDGGEGRGGEGRVPERWGREGRGEGMGQGREYN